MACSRMESFHTQSSNRTAPPFGYAPALITPGLWMHKAINIMFFLAAYDFGKQYKSKE